MTELLAALSAERLYLMGAALVRFIVILTLAWLASRFITKLVRGLRGRIIAAMARGAGDHPDELEKRAATIIAIIKRTAVTSVWVVALVMALREMGFDIGPILAGAGIVGLAVGFGAQNLVRDVITGLFMLVENQLRIGDGAELNGVSGLVEELNLRTTVLRSADGAVHVFPNGTITKLSNLTRDFSYAIFEVRAPYGEDTDRICDLIRQVSQDLIRQPTLAPEMLENAEVFGVDRLAESAVIIQGRIKTRPGKQGLVNRAFNRRLKQRFDELGIEFPISNQFRPPAKPPAPPEAEIEAMVRKVLEEEEKPGGGEEENWPD